jgi:hypothetical protein
VIIIQIFSSFVNFDGCRRNYNFMSKIADLTNKEKVSFRKELTFNIVANIFYIAGLIYYYQSNIRNLGNMDEK